MASSPPSSHTLVDLLGPELLTSANGPTKPTKELLKGKEFIALYFSASWCGPCKGFSPMLKEFHQHVAASHKFQVVFISSDRSVPEFERYYASMPWLALPPEGTAHLKNQLAQILQIQGIPTVVVLNAQADYLTNQGRVQVSNHCTSKAKAQALITEWKQTKAVPISQAIMPQQGPQGIWKAIYFILRNPLYIFGALYLWKTVMRYLDDYMDDDHDTGKAGGEL